uniref:Secreted protein n=1 Tax=Eutreptiella gymnastica TaxID=73025 RepID=A0A7S1JGJ8_9EUGL
MLLPRVLVRLRFCLVGSQGIQWPTVERKHFRGTFDPSEIPQHRGSTWHPHSVNGPKMGQNRWPESSERSRSGLRTTPFGLIWGPLAGSAGPNHLHLARKDGPTRVYESPSRHTQVV